MSTFARLSDLFVRLSGSALTALVDAVRTVFGGDPQLRRQVAFSIALIALSAKMAKADGVVTQAEVRAFHEIFSVPREELRNVARLYDLAKKDVAGFEAYARQMAGLCGSGVPNCAMLEDILDGLFHIAKADGVLHEREEAFLARVAEIFAIDENEFAQIRARHVGPGKADPYVVLGLPREATFQDIRRRYRQLVAENHPDRMIARGVPEEFVAIANSRLAALNVAYEQLTKSRRSA
ncbi:DnaJ family molecular chaperone [Chelativorans sp. M5D2P16]|uniref:DnaJ family molecular chaperone n=1 Tax=Chelativorans sp. M5D2P16 TaxID=3095678 RepID=UPI002ACA253D|nr:DnaJ family molecular chaperone [Chelativorans sp. M5D2P16]MDZ5698151.1 DnaJ family molecular chaperone [Chelativorans sp. M5D2P16]